MAKQLIENDIMSLEGVLLNELPSGFTTTGSLNLNNSNIEKLPENMIIGGDLIIGNANIKELPQGLKIGKNLLMFDKEFPLPADIVIGGKIFTKNAITEPPFQKDNMIMINDKKITFKYKKLCYNGHFVENDYFYPEVYYYYGINPKDSAIEFTENEKTYIIPCESPRDGFKRVDWRRAETFGIYKYADYDVDEFRTVDELKEIYQTCTGACESGIVKFKNLLNIDDNKLYTIRQLAEMVAKQKWISGSVIVFFEFFNLKELLEK